jgi:DNA-directed RNA polymerase specialized sigma24 family protein
MSDPMLVELSALLISVAQRDEAALASLYDALGGAVHGHALRLTGDAAAADALTEATFWRVWREAPRFDPQHGAAAAWVLSLAQAESHR